METKNIDAVYFVRDGENDELRFSLRSVEKNLPIRKVWIYGGKPEDIQPDEFVRIPQPKNEGTKWDCVRANFQRVAENPEITEDFILMNDDFFINQPTDRIEPHTAGTLQEHIDRIERNYRNAPTTYTIELRRAQRVLEEAGLTTNSYELHIPMIINRKKLAETLAAFPPRHATRSLYGNLHQIGGTRAKDCKIIRPEQPFNRDAQFLSSDDSTWGDTELARFIRQQFPDKSRWEI